MEGKKFELEVIKGNIGQEEFDKINGMESADELYEEVQKELFSDGDSEELSEENLDMVVGGMSKWKAVQIVTVAYYDMCRYGYSDRTYKWSTIKEALDICDKMAVKVRNWSVGTLIKFFTTGSPF